LKNPEAHYYTTGPEIWEQTQGKVDVFVSVAGSGGTVSGVGRYLKEKNPNIQVIAVDPLGSVYYRYFKHGTLPKPHEMPPCAVEGAGEDHLALSMDFSVIDDIVQFQDQDAFLTARQMAKQEGLLVGGSSGANVWAALQIAQSAKQHMRIVTLLPDNGIKYLSKFHNDAWMQEKGFI
jgi:cysteine synthase